MDLKRYISPKIKMLRIVLLRVTKRRMDLLDTFIKPRIKKITSKLIVKTKQKIQIVKIKIKWPIYSHVSSLIRIKLIIINLLVMFQN